MYETGYGEELNIPKARYWYEKAIENGYTKAICRLGVTYYDDEDDPGAAEKAFYWLNRSAELSDAEGCYYLAMCYQHGIGTEKSISLALKYMKKAKELGYPAAESPTEMIRHMDVN